MKAKLFSVVLCCLIVGTSAQAFGRAGLSVAGGYNESEEISFFRGAIKLAPGWTWFEGNIWQVGLHFDLGFILMNNESDVVNTNGAADDLQAISLTPVFRLQRVPYENTVAPFIEGAVGVSLFSEDTLQSDQPIGLNFGGAFQFEDILSLGVRFGRQQQFELSANYFHYSNLGFYDENDGIDIFSVTFGVWF